jgi:hypothetical protein
MPAERVCAAMAVPSSDYADNPNEVHKRLIDACRAAATARGMTLPSEVDLLTEDAWRDQFGDETPNSFWSAIGEHEADLVLIMATGVASAL